MACQISTLVEDVPVPEVPSVPLCSVVFGFNGEFIFNFASFLAVLYLSRDKRGSYGKSCEKTAIA